MGIVFSIEALKFHKLKEERFPRILFVILLAVNLFIAILSPGDRNFDALLQFLNDQIQLIGFNSTTESLTPSDIPLTKGNLIFLSVQILLFLFNIFMGLLYAGAYTSERLKQPAALGIKAMLRSLPKLILLVLMLIIPTILSSFLMWLPIIVILCGLSFMPFLFSEKRMSFFEAVKRSWTLTRTHKLSIFLSFFFLNAIKRLITMVVGYIAPDQMFILQVLMAFLTTIFALMKGRLLGLLYVFYTRQVTVLKSGFMVMTDMKDIFNDTLTPLPDDVFIPEIRNLSRYKENSKPSQSDSPFQLNDDHSIRGGSSQQDRPDASLPNEQEPSDRDQDMNGK